MSSAAVATWEDKVGAGVAVAPHSPGSMLGILFTFWVYGIPFLSEKRILFSS